MKQGLVRIIAGQWRGRRIQVPDVQGLRPTPDRVRETLFNWLTPYVVGANCLDLFAGSGVLGFEALSRGAEHVTLVDASPEVITHLRATQALLGAGALEIYRAHLPQGMIAPSRPYDIVFIDPPYEAGLLFPCCEYLENNHFLADEAYLYLEAKHRIEANALPSNWQLIKSAHAGQVYYHLARRIIQRDEA